MLTPMNKPRIKPLVRLDGIEARLVVNRVIKALTQAGADDEYINEYLKQIKGQSYTVILRVTHDYVSVY